MSEQRFWSALDRGIWDHPLWEGQRFSQREAFQWLFSNASFRSRRVRVGNHMVELQRGQLVGSRAFLAKKWGWGEQEVRTYLKLLEAEGMIVKSQHSNQRLTIITICNYGKFQNEHQPANQQSNRDPTNTQPTPNQSQNTNTRLHEEEKRERGRASANSLDLNPWSETVNHGVEVQPDGRVRLVNGTEAEWLQRFGDDREALDDALIEVAGYIQPMSRQPIKLQVERGLARIARERRERDQRYERAAARKPSPNRPEDRPSITTMFAKHEECKT